jgi:hypothetical protein
LGWGVGLAAGAAAAAPPCASIEVFERADCPHCAQAERFLAELASEHPGLAVTRRDVDADPSAADRLVRLAAEHGAAHLGVPAFLVCDRLVVGFSPGVTDQEIRQRVAGAAAPAEGELVLPWLGRIDVERIGLPLFTVAMGLVDGFNPCAMWVLLFLLSLLVHLRGRARMLLVAGTFVLVSGAAYFAFMAAWLNVYLWLGLSRGLQISVGLAAVAIGSLHLKEFFAFRRGPSLAIPERAKPGIYARVRRIVTAENLTGALAGAFVLAVLVSAVELLCTAGLPAVYTQILSAQDLEPARHYGYLALYNLAYVADDAAVLAVAVATLSRRRLQARGGRWLELLSGAVILLLGLLLIFAPGALA